MVFSRADNSLMDMFVWKKRVRQEVIYTFLDDKFVEAYDGPEKLNLELERSSMENIMKYTYDVFLESTVKSLLDDVLNLTSKEIEERYRRIEAMLNGYVYKMNEDEEE